MEVKNWKIQDYIRDLRKGKSVLTELGRLKNSLSIDPLRILSIISKGELNIFNLVG